MKRTATKPSRRGAFTLVELLVVIGIIALLVAMLLPALNTARRQANSVKCLAQLNQVGLAIMMYANQNKGVVIPTFIRGDGTIDPVTTTPIKDNWAMLLVTSKLIPAPGVVAGSSSTSGGNVLVCPEIRDICADTNVPGQERVANSTDGFDRRVSHLIQPGLMVDYGYGINGATYSVIPAEAGAGSTYYDLPSTSISIHPNTKCVPLKRISAIKGSSEMVIIFDGYGWNPHAFPKRLTGLRHGKINRQASVMNTGIVNLLFLDGHAESANRADCPANDTLPANQQVDQWIGTTAQMRTTKYRWNVKHLK